MTSDLSQSFRKALIALAPFGASGIVATRPFYSAVGLAYRGRSTLFAGVPACRYGSHARRSFDTDFGVSSKSTMHGSPRSGHR